MAAASRGSRLTRSGAAGPTDVVPLAFWDDAAQRRRYRDAGVAPAARFGSLCGGEKPVRLAGRMPWRTMISLVISPPPAPLARGSTRLVPMGADSLTDEDLLERVARDRDEAAFGVLYHRYARAVYSLVMRLLRDRHAGEDV